MGTQIMQIAKINRGTTIPGSPGWHREAAWIADYPPAKGDVIAVIGAYSGTTARMLYDLAPQAQYHLFEPQDWAVAQLRERFPYLNVCIHPFGLGDRTGGFRMALYTSNGCTLVKGGIEYRDTPDNYCHADLVEFDAACGSIGIREIHHASINIEAFEYVMIPHMARTGWLAKCKTLGVSWHGSRWNTVVPGPFSWLGKPVLSWEEVQGILSQTHDIHLEIDNWQTWVRREE